MRCAQRPSPPRGLTLVELVVVVAMLGILAMVLLPSTRSARGAAHRVQCRNHLKQIAAATWTYHETFGRGPLVTTAMRDLEPPPQDDVTAASWESIFRCPVETLDPDVGAFSYLFCDGHGSFADSPNGMIGEDDAVVSLEDVPDGTSTTILLAEKLLSIANTPADDSRRTVWSAIRGRPAERIYERPDDPRRVAWRCDAVDPDDLDQTVAVCADARTDFVPANDPLERHGGILHGAGRGITTVDSPNAPSWFLVVSETTGAADSSSGDRARTLWSLSPTGEHPGGVSVAYVDGTARFVSEQISRTIWQALGTRNREEELSQADF